MKKLALLAVLAGTLAFGQAKKVVASNIQWWGYKLAKTEASSHTGTLGLKSGNLVMKGNAVVGGSFVFDMSTISSTDLTGDYKIKLDSHLKNGDFFEIEKFPTASYKITSVKKGSDKNYPFVINGNLTIKGKTNAVSFPAAITNNKGVISIASNKFNWDRQKFDVVYKSTMKDVVVKDDIDMQIKISAQ
jgi:polyisoprenoid-binding protein YceI